MNIVSRVLAIKFALLAMSVVVILVFVMTLGVKNVYAQGTTVLYVAANGTDQGNCQSQLSPCKTLQYTLDQASNNDTIMVLSGIYANSNVNAGAVIPTGLASITITAGTSQQQFISVQNSSSYSPTPGSGGSVLTINQSQTVYLSHVGLEEGYSYFGGGIYNNGGTVYLNNDLLILNRAKFGGGIYNGGVMNILNSQLYANAAIPIVAICNNGTTSCTENAFGGGIYNYGTLSVNQSVISNNVAKIQASTSYQVQLFGGGIFNANQMLITQSSIDSNEITLYGFSAPAGYILQGGGIYNQSQQATLISDTIVSNTTASSTKSGAGIFAGPGFLGTSILDIGSSYIENNSDLAQYALNDNCVLGSGSGTINSLGYNISNTSDCNLNQSTDLPLTQVQFDGKTSIPTIEAPIGSNPYSSFPGNRSIPFNTVFTPFYGSTTVACPAVDELGNARPAPGATSCTVGAIEPGSTLASLPKISSSATYFDAEVGKAVSTTFSATGSPSSIFSVTSGSLPPGLSLNPVSGQLKGIPTTSGSYTFVVSANNGDGTSTVSIIFSVALAATATALAFNPSLTEQGVITIANVGVSVLSGSSPNAYVPTGNVDILTLGSSTPLCVISLSVTNGAGSCTLPNLSPNSYALIAKYMGSGEFGVSQSTVVTLTVNNKLSLSTIQPINITVGTATVISPVIQGGVGVVTFSYQGTLPPGLVFNPSNGEVGGVVDTSGVYSFVIEAVDSLDISSTQDVNVTVSQDQPVLTINSLDPVVAGTTVNLSAHVAGFSPTGTISFLNISVPSNPTQLCNANIQNSNASCSFISSTEDYFIYASYFGDLNNKATTSTTVNLYSASPLTIITSSLPTATVGTYYKADILGSGGTSPVAWQVNSGGLPAGLSFSPQGVISGTPQSFGNFSITFEVTDSNTILEQSKKLILILNISQQSGGSNANQPSNYPSNPLPGSPIGSPSSATNTTPSNAKLNSGTTTINSKSNSNKASTNFVNGKRSSDNSDKSSANANSSNGSAPTKELGARLTHNSSGLDMVLIWLVLLLLILVTAVLLVARRITRHQK